MKKDNEWMLHYMVGVVVGIILGLMWFSPKPTKSIHIHDTTTVTVSERFAIDPQIN